MGASISIAPMNPPNDDYFWIIIIYMSVLLGL